MRGALPLRRRLIGLLKHDPDVQLLGYSCFGQCDYGPNVALYPPGEWYGGLSSPEDAERVVCYAHGGQPGPATKLVLPEEERQLHLRNIEELVRTRERDRDRARHWWWPF
jgi:(2Fe-2S) ferredoxin